MSEREVDRIIELEQRLTLCQYVIFDAADTLVYDDPEYLQFLTIKTIQELKPDAADNLDIQSSSKIYSVATTLGLTVDEFWSKFKKIRHQEDIKSNYQSIKVFPDAIALRSLQDKTLLMVTHAPPDLVEVYQKKILEATGVLISWTNTPYNYPNPYKVLKPDRRLVDDLMLKAGLASGQQSITEILYRTSVIGDDQRDIQLGYNIGAIPILIDRNNLMPKISEPFLRHTNLQYIPHAFKGTLS